MHILGHHLPGRVRDKIVRMLESRAEWAGIVHDRAKRLMDEGKREDANKEMLQFLHDMANPYVGLKADYRLPTVQTRKGTARHAKSAASSH